MSNSAFESTLKWCSVIWIYQKANFKFIWVIDHQSHLKCLLPTVWFFYWTGVIRWYPISPVSISWICLKTNIFEEIINTTLDIMHSVSKEMIKGACISFIPLHRAYWKFVWVCIWSNHRYALHGKVYFIVHSFVLLSEIRLFPLYKYWSIEKMEHSLNKQA